MPEPNTVIPARVSSRTVLSAHTACPAAIKSGPRPTHRSNPAGEREAPSAKALPNAPSPTAACNQPSVRASPPKNSRATNGASVAAAKPENAVNAINSSGPRRPGLRATWASPSPSARSGWGRGGAEAGRAASGDRRRAWTMTRTTGTQLAASST